DRLRHARPGRGDDPRPSRRGHARRSHPAGRRAAAALRRPREPVRRSLHRLTGDEPRLGAARRQRGRLRAVPRARARRAPDGRLRRPRDHGHPAGGIRGRRVRRGGSAADRGRRARDRGARRGRARLLRGGRRAGDRRGRPLRRRERRRDAPDAARQGALHRARRPAHVGASRPAAAADDRPAASLLLLADDRREPERPPRGSLHGWLIRHLEYTRARFAQVSERLLACVHPETHAVDELLVAGPVDRISWADAQRLEYRPAALGDRLGPAWATFWFRIRATIPEEWAGSRVDLLFASQSEGALWRDGRIVQGLNTGGAGERPDATIAREAEPGPVDLQVEVACNGMFGALGAPAELRR